MDKAFYQSVKNELFNDILPYWEKHSRDTENKGFFGAIDNNNKSDAACERSIVMTSRYLWTYSAVARATKDVKYLEMADFAFDVIKTKYWDKDNGGVFWSVMPDGTPKVTKKQIYGEAFCCYGLSEYAAALKELRNSEASEESMNYALDLYDLLEHYAYDSEFGGYVEARAINWSYTDDMILSEKDMNCPKSMNTNLHVMEAYTNLYRTIAVVFPDARSVRSEIGKSLAFLVRTTTDSILQKNYHLAMFFDMQWNSLGDEVSYGHDIEASWLLWEAACELNDDELKTEIRDTVIKMAETAYAEGFDQTAGCMENFTKNGQRNRNRVWWTQAESINGFYNAWQMTSEKKYEDACDLLWNWIQNYQLDKKNGEWWNEVDENGNPILSENKGGNWKTSYHNGRTCLEILRRSHNL